MKIYKIPIFLFITLFFFFLFLRPLEMEDVWWHLSAGRWMVTQGQIPHQDMFAFSQERQPWVFTQWLGSLLLYDIYSLGGETGSVIFRSLFVLVILLIFAFWSYRKIPFVLLIALLFLMAQGLALRNLYRPLLFNFLFISIFLILLLDYEKRLDFRRIFFIPLLGILWVNIHLGSFAYGVPLIGIFLAASFFELIKHHPEDGEARRVLTRKARTLSIIFAAYLLIFLVNPYGIEGALHPLKVFFQPGYIHFYQYKGMISEMQSPVHLLGQNYGICCMVLMISCLLALIANPQRRLSAILLFSFVSVSFFYSIRGVDFFAIVCGYLIADNVAPLVDMQNWMVSRRDRYMEAAVYILILSAFVIWGFGKMPRFLSGQNPVNPVSLWGSDESMKFEPCLQAIQGREGTGQIFNDDIFGGYIIWKEYPRLRPFVDGRQLDHEHFFRYVQILFEPDKFWPQAEQRFNFQVVLVDPSRESSTSFIKYLNAQPKWENVYRNDACQAFVRRPGN